MTNEEKINRLRNIQRCRPIKTMEEYQDFEALEASIEDIKTLGEIESRHGNALKELIEERLSSNRLMAVSGMSVEELTDALMKGYRLVSPEEPRERSDKKCCNDLFNQEWFDRAEPSTNTGKGSEREEMTLDKAIEHAEEVAEEQDKLCKRYDDASGYTRSHNEDIRTSDAKQCERCAEEHRQLAEWLTELKQLRERAQWIPTKERLPDCGEDVLTCNSNGFIEIQSLEIPYGYWADQHGDATDFDEVVKWMPLPKSHEPH